MKVVVQPTLKQYEAYQILKDDKTKFLLFGGGAGGGKSWLGCEWLLMNCYLHPGSRWFIGREELKRLMSSTFVTFNKVASHHKIPEKDFTLNGQYNYIQFFNGSRIDLLDLKFLPRDPSFYRFGSLEYTGGWIEEAGEVDFGAFDVLKSRIGRHQNMELKSKLLLTCNPTKNWVYHTFYKPDKEDELPKEYAFIQSLYNDNPHTAKEYGENLSSISDPVTRQRLRDGNWEYDDSQDALMSYDAITDLFSNKAPVEDTRYITADIARFGKDKTVIMLWQGYKVQEVHTFTKKSTVEVAKEIAALAQEKSVYYSRIVIDEDGVGGGVVDQLRGIKGFVANSSPIKNVRGENENFQNLKTQCTYKLAELVNDRKIEIDVKDPIRTYIIEELEQIRRKDIDKDGKLKLVPKEDIKTTLGRSPDYADCLMMRMLYEVQPVRKIQARTFTYEIERY